VPAAHDDSLAGSSISPVACAFKITGDAEVTTMGFMDLREWMHLLEKTGELRRVAAEVDWDREIGAVARRVLEKKGPALLFENIKGYAGGRCTKLFVNGFGSRARLALALGFSPDATNRDLVQHVMKKNRETIAPVVVETGPVKDVVVRGDAIDQTEFPVPKWHYLEGGRYIHTFSAIVTRDPDTRVMNVGVYRGMIGAKDTTPFLLIKGGQHWGAHFLKWAARGKPMPVACVIGFDPIMPFIAGSPIAPGLCEWDVMGAYRGEPLPLVRCETVDLEVPASAEIVIEGTIGDDPASYELEGPFGEFTGYVSDLPTPRPAMKISCITHRRDPVFRGTLEGTLPGSYSENSVMSSVQRAAIAWNILNGAGIPGILDVYAPPITNGVNLRVQIRKHYQGQPKQIAAALWGNSAAQYRYKHVIVVEEDIDPAVDEQVEWAFAHRVNAGEGGVVIFPGIFGSPIDPSTPMEDRDVAQLGSGLWNRMLIDATRSWKNPRRPEWGGERFPPTVRPSPDDEARVTARWTEYGLGDL
jgi:4-hydroxy-3-polyprenylbenzoate decarboxylase